MSVGADDVFRLVTGLGLAAGAFYGVSRAPEREKNWILAGIVAALLVVAALGIDRKASDILQFAGTALLLGGGFWLLRRLFGSPVALFTLLLGAQVARHFH